MFLINRVFYAALFFFSIILVAAFFFHGVADAGTVYGYVDCAACSSSIKLTFVKGNDVKTIYADRNKNYRTYLSLTGEYTVTIESGVNRWTYSIRSSSRARRQDISLH